MKIQPFVSGSGMSGKGMTKALAIIQIVDPEVQLAPSVQLTRGQSLSGLVTKNFRPLLLIGNPHGLHAQMILDGISAGFENIIVDKPVCVSKDDIPKLKKVSQDVAVCHGFRQQWGPQTIKKMIEAGEFGEIISVEGRYWQSSSAQWAVEKGKTSTSTKDWKNDPKLHGPYDALVDLGAHYTDLMFFFANDIPKKSSAWVSHVNSPAPHRDSHAWVEFQFPKFRARGSISKTVHGTGNDLELTVLGAKQAVTWSMEKSDTLKIAQGGKITILQKPNDKFGSQQPPFHGMGWIEGYIEIIHNYLMKMGGNASSTYPTLHESLKVMETLLNIDVG